MKNKLGSLFLFLGFLLSCSENSDLTEFYIVKIFAIIFIIIGVICLKEIIKGEYNGNNN